MRFATTRSKISGRTAKHFANFGNRSAEPYTGGLEDLQPGPARPSFVVAAQCGSRRLFRELLADHRLSKRSIDNRYSLNGRSWNSCMDGAGEGNRTPDLRFTKPCAHRSPCSEQSIVNRIRCPSFGYHHPGRAPLCTLLCTTCFSTVPRFSRTSPCGSITLTP